ncbi:hypothetical protein HPB47_002458 [Ixodes persulcatus]|uniref:Uncharacterized protein n=1 Tax=Ixodes persulcatus TaxID=34615 RepID=A0AC60PM46_IXOPE|nr:hypothetical protein HPB47_002458 [Ixodes persulcatus]
MGSALFTHSAAKKWDWEMRRSPPVVEGTASDFVREAVLGNTRNLCSVSWRESLQSPSERVDGLDEQNFISPLFTLALSEPVAYLERVLAHRTHLVQLSSRASAFRRTRSNLQVGIL